MILHSLRRRLLLWIGGLLALAMPAFAFAAEDEAQDPRPGALQLASQDLDEAAWSTFHLRRGVLEIAVGNLEIAREHLEACELDSGTTFDEAGRAAFLLAHVQLRLGDVEGLTALVARVSAWPTQSFFTRWIAYQLLLLNTRGDSSPDGPVSSGSLSPPSPSLFQEPFEGLSPDFAASDLLIASMLLQEDQPELALQFLGTAHGGSKTSLHRLYLRAIAQERVGLESMESWSELSGATPQTPFQVDLVAIACIRSAALFIAGEQDPTPFLKRVPEGSRFAPRARHMGALWLAESGHIDKAREELEAFYLDEPTYRDRRQVGFYLGGDALDRREVDTAYRIYSDLDVAWVNAYRATEALGDSLGLEQLWSAWDDAAFWPQELMLDLSRAWVAGGELADRSLDLRGPPKSPIPPPYDPATESRNETSLKSLVPPPTRGERASLAELRSVSDAASRELARARWDLARREDELARRRAFLDQGLRIARGQADRLAPVSSQLDSLLAHMDSLVAGMESIKDAATLRFTRRTGEFLDTVRDHRLWIEAMRHFHVAGPERRRPRELPHSVPSPEQLLNQEAALLQLVELMALEFMEKAPHLLEDSFSRHWAPGVRNQTARLDSLAGAQSAGLGQLELDLLAALEGLDGGPELAALREHVGNLDLRLASLEAAYADLRDEIGRRALNRALAALENEREALDYGLSASTYELGVNTLEAGGDIKQDSLSVDIRNRARLRLAGFLETYPNSAARGEVRFRLADLQLVHAKEEFNRRMARFLNDELPAEGIDDKALVPFVDYEPALALYRQILNEDPGFPHRDAVLFNLGMILSDQGESESSRHLQQLVAESPDSPFCQEAYLRLGDDLFDRADFAACIPLYEQAARGDDPGFTAIALYRMGWAHFSEDRFPASTDAFRRLMDHYGAEQEIALKADLRVEAENYLIHSLVRAGGASYFAEYFDSVGLRDYEARALTGMSQILREFSLYPEAVEADRLFLERYPDNPDALASARRLIDSYERWNHPADAREARLLYAPRFTRGSRWFGMNQADTLQAGAEEFVRTSYQFVALHHHHQARAGKGGDESWRSALDLYNTLIELWPHHREAARYHLYAGEAAAHLEEYPEAVMHYETAVAEFYAHETDVQAGTDRDSDLKYCTVTLAPETYGKVLDADWQRLAVTDTWYRSTIPAGQTLGDDSLAVAVRITAQGFFERHETDTRAPDALWRKASLGFAHGWFEDAARDYRRLVKAYPEDKRAPEAAALGGDALYRAGRFDLAGDAYREALVVSEAAGVDSLVKRLRPVIPLCAYRHAEETEKTHPDDPVRAANLYQDLATTWPDYRHAGDALYRAGLGFSAAGQVDAAFRVWDRLTYRYPDHEYAKDANLRIAAMFDASGDHARAAEAYERISRSYPDDPNAAGALLKAADLRTAGGDSATALLNQLEYIDRFPEDYETAMSILIDLAVTEVNGVGTGNPISTLIGSGADSTYLFRYLELAETHPEFASPDLMGQVQFLKGEEAFEHYASLKLTLPIEKSIDAKRKELERLLEIYGTCATFGAPEWARAAAYRIGEALLEFGESLETSERPTELTGDDLLAYDDVLIGEAWTFYDRGEEVWSDILRETRNLTDDPGGWIARTRDTLWPRLSQKFFYMPEVVYPTVEAIPASPVTPEPPVEKAEKEEE